MKRMTVILILALVGLCAASGAALAQSPEITASEVVDRETLQAFVEGAKAQLESSSGRKAVLGGKAPSTSFVLLRTVTWSFTVLIGR